jgi:hypothetical protein
VAEPSGGCQPWRVIKDAKDAPTRRRQAQKARPEEPAKRRTLPEVEGLLE